jgi:hypothetical protein
MVVNSAQLPLANAIRATFGRHQSGDGDQMARGHCAMHVGCVCDVWFYV